MKYILYIFLVFVLFGCNPVKKYTGEVVQVSSWSGNATLKTKTENGKDTLVTVVRRKYERFVVGQILTCWSGGDMISNCSTLPQ